MQPVMRKSLQQNLLTTLAVAALVFSVIAGSGSFIWNYRAELERSNYAFDNLAATVASSAAIAAYVNNEAIAQDICEGLLKNPGILAVRIIGNRGFDFTRSKPNVTLRWQDEVVLDYPIYSPTNAREQVGTLSILTNANMVTSRAQDAALKQVFGLIGQVLIIAVILAIAYQRRVGTPLLKMTEQLAQIEPGSSQRLQINARDSGNEIGQVASSVNSYLAISERALLMERELRDRLQRLENHYQRILESTNVGIIVLNMQGELINCNAVASSRRGRASPEQPTDNPLDYLNHIFKKPANAWLLIEQARASGNVASGDLELLSDRSEDHWAHCLFSVDTIPEEQRNYIEVVFYDVTSRRKREEKALRIAERDSLTDLVNRRGAIGYLERNLDEAKLDGQRVTLFFLDLDGFKSINDNYGHAAGDSTLQEVARRLLQLRKRSSDLLCRFGGDEFIIAIYGTHNKSSAVPHNFAQMIIDALRQPILIGEGQMTEIGVSVGIASYPETANDVDSLLEAADHAMYEAKKRGRNNYHFAPTKTAAT